MHARSTSHFLPVDNETTTDLGPCLNEAGVTYRVWALGHVSVCAQIERRDGSHYTLELSQAKEPGYFSGIDAHGRAGDLYRFSIDGGPPIPDFISHFQPKGVQGPSMVVDARAYRWEATEWQRPAWSGNVVYECHLGTFTPEGTFRSAIEKLDHLASLGITALELMPIAEWAGERNWGYDGVMLFAPSRCYGNPNDLRALIDACHLRGLAVILDVVFNHLGPEGNFSHQYSDYYFHQGRDNPWGQNFNLDGPNSEPVRALLRQNIRYWLDDFRIDGFRMDATHAIHDPSPLHAMAGVADVVHERKGFIIAEDDRNAREILEPHEKNGWNFDAIWADDFHHSLRVSQTLEQETYYSIYKGSIEEIVRTLRQGWLYTGEFSSFHKGPRGAPCDEFPPECFVYCISNHDQVGNRILGNRLHHEISPAAYRALSLFLCLVPYSPMLFMGQEWGASSPFLYFTDMPDDLGVKIREGRKREFVEAKVVADFSGLEKMSEPQDVETFLRSKLNWDELTRDGHCGLLDLYRAGLKLRRELFGRGNPPRDCWQVEARESAVALQYRLGERRIEVCLHLGTTQINLTENARVLLRSNVPEFARAAMNEGPETVVTIL